MTMSNVLEQNLRNANRITAEEIVPGDLIVLGHWHGITTRAIFLVLSTSFEEKGRLGLCVDVTTMGAGRVSSWLWHQHQWIEVHR